MLEVQWGSLLSWEMSIKKNITWASLLPYRNAFGVLHQCVKHRCVVLSGFHLEVGATCQYRMHTTYGHSKIHFQAHVNFKRQLFYSFCFIYYWTGQRGLRYQPFSWENMPPDSLGIDNTTGGGGWVSPRGWQCTAAVLVGTGLASSLLFHTNGCRKCSSAFVGAPFLA